MKERVALPIPMLKSLRSSTGAFSFSTVEVLLGALALAGCSSEDNGTAATGGAVGAPQGGMTATGGTTTGGSVATGGTVSTGGSVSGGSGSGGGGQPGAPSSGGAAGGGGGGAGGTAGGTTAGAGGGGSGGGGAGGGGAGGKPEAPAMLSETGLFMGRAPGPGGELMLAPGVREFQPKYWLWSDGSDKKRYVFLPPGTKIDTTNPDRWSLPVGAKLWKSFISNGQLVETRLIERFGAGPDDFLFATYFWETADAADASKMRYKDLLLDAAGTTHDIPNGMMCERCHNTSRERALGFSALQLNHDLGGVTLATLVNESLLTNPIPLTIKMPGADQQTQDALGYLHANCGNCHNAEPGLPLESIPEPQLSFRVLIADQTLEDTATWKTVINQKTTASSELAIDYRIKGGSEMDSAAYFRMTQRMIEDQMPPIGTEVKDETGLAMLRAWIQSLPPPATP